MTVALIGSSTVSKEANSKLLLSRNPQAPLEVLDNYYALESEWQIRADALVAQMFLETDFLRSWWSQPPRRNMAGIGVTGQSQKTDPQSNAWAFKQEDGTWYAGYSFADWHAAVESHFAHMSAYVYPDEHNNASQKDPRYKAARQAFAANKWPVAQVLTDLNGRWAVPGTDYGQKIENIMNVAAQLAPAASATTSAATTSAAAQPQSTTTTTTTAQTAPAIIDLSDKTPDSVYTNSRDPYKVIVLVLHDTVGGASDPDRNDPSFSSQTLQAREDGTIRWFQGGGGLSIHYLVGPEALGAKIYRLCKEDYVAYHAGGTANFPSSWTAPDGTKYEGRYNGASVINYISIGIERWGSDSEQAGPNQTAAMTSLALDIARRYNLTPQQIVAHKELEGDRSDGGVLRDAIRAALSQPVTPVVVALPTASAPADKPTTVQVLSVNSVMLPAS